MPYAPLGCREPQQVTENWHQINKWTMRLPSYIPFFFSVTFSGFRRRPRHGLISRTLSFPPSFFGVLRTESHVSCETLPHFSDVKSRLLKSRQWRNDCGCSLHRRAWQTIQRIPAGQLPTAQRWRRAESFRSSAPDVANYARWETLGRTYRW